MAIIQRFYIFQMEYTEKQIMLGYNLSPKSRKVLKTLNI